MPIDYEAPPPRPHRSIRGGGGLWDRAKGMAGGVVDSVQGRMQKYYIVQDPDINDGEPTPIPAEINGKAQPKGRMQQLMKQFDGALPTLEEWKEKAMAGGQEAIDSVAEPLGDLKQDAEFYGGEAVDMVDDAGGWTKDLIRDIRDKIPGQERTPLQKGADIADDRIEDMRDAINRRNRRSEYKFQKKKRAKRDGVPYYESKYDNPNKKPRGDYDWDPVLKKWIKRGKKRDSQSFEEMNEDIDNFNRKGRR